jgi:WD40 repeat protein
VAVAPDGQRILSSSFKPKVDPDHYRELTFEERFDCDGSGSAEVRVWLANGALERIVSNLHTYEVTALVALPDNQHALSGSRDSTVKLFNIGAGFDINDGPVLRTFKHHRGAVNCLALTPDGRRFVSGSRDKTACIVYHGTATRSV